MALALWGSLGQVVPAATTLTAAYTVPALRHAVITVIITNEAAAAATVRLAHAVNGAANANQQYMLYDYALAANATTTTARFTVNAGDIVRVYASSGTVSFNINGIEEDN